MADSRNARDLLESISIADHMGDVNNDLPRLAELLGEPGPPVWCDICNGYQWPWEESFDAEYGHVEDYEAHDD